MAEALDIGVFGMRGIPSTYSGYETFLTSLLPELAARGHLVTAYCRHSATGTWRPDPYLGVERRTVPSVRTKQLDTLSHGVAAAAVARLRAHDVWLVCNVANTPMCTLARASGQRIVLNTDGQEWLRGKWGPTGRRVFRTFARRSRWAASALVSDCRAMREVYRSQFGAFTTVIPYCFTPLSNPPVSDPAPVTGQYFVTGGRLVPENNIDAIAAAFSRTRVDQRLVVLGAANYRSPVQVALEDLAARDHRIVVLGHVADRERFAAILRGATAYLHGHSVGGMNPSLVEAMGSGAVIAALDTPFNREVAGTHAMYFKDCGASLQDTLHVLASLAPADSVLLRRANARRAVERFPLDAVADAYEALLRRAAATPAYGSVVLRTRWDEPELARVPFGATLRARNRVGAGASHAPTGTNGSAGDPRPRPAR
jgi:glycosyltransferase involved in cell wall biosynthesis